MRFLSLLFTLLVASVAYGQSLPPPGYSYTIDVSSTINGVLGVNDPQRNNPLLQNRVIYIQDFVDNRIQVAVEGQSYSLTLDLGAKGLSVSIDLSDSVKYTLAVDSEGNLWIEFDIKSGSEHITGAANTRFNIKNHFQGLKTAADRLAAIQAILASSAYMQWRLAQTQPPPSNGTPYNPYYDSALWQWGVTYGPWKIIVGPVKPVPPLPPIP